MNTTTDSEPLLTLGFTGDAWEFFYSLLQRYAEEATALGGAGLSVKLTTADGLMQDAAVEISGLTGDIWDEESTPTLQVRLWVGTTGTDWGDPIGVLLYDPVTHECNVIKVVIQ